MIVALLAAAGVTVLLLAECVLRFYHRRFSREYFYPPNRRTIFRVHSEISPDLPAEPESRTNALGERGNDPPEVGRLYRGLVVGGSAAECALLDQDQSWPIQIQHNLSRAIQDGLLGADAAHVGCMSRSGLTTEGISLALSRLLPSFPKLDFIIIHTSASDFLRWIDCGAPAHPSFPRARDVEVLGVCRSQAFGLKPKSLALTHYLRAFAASTICAERIRRSIGRQIVECRKLRAESLPHVPLETDPTPVFSKLRAELTDLIELCRQHVRHVIVVPQLWLEPAQPSRDTDALLWFGRLNKFLDGALGKSEFVVHSDVRRLFSTAYEIVLETAAANGVHSLPLRGTVAQEPQNFYDDAHYSVRGAALLGKVVAAKILEIESSSGSR